MIEVLRTRNEIQNLVKALESTEYAFVPTMGNLHEGHLSLIRRAIDDYKITICSIFVNPTQFAPNEDFKQYPRTLEDDVKKISSLQRSSEQKIYIFAPKSEKELYPEKTESDISAGELGKILCGVTRPHFFDGVATIVFKLFELIKPTTAYFGEKDYQQLLVIKNMVKERNLPIEVVGLPLVRDHNGLALSSRNQYLKTEQKEKALVLKNTLKLLSNQIKGHTWQEVEASTTDMINKILLEDKNWDYLQVRRVSDLEFPKSLDSELIVLGAYQLDHVRLIDNIKVNDNEL